MLGIQHWQVRRLTTITKAGAMPFIRIAAKYKH
jgi:hypothetical protein